MHERLVNVMRTAKRGSIEQSIALTRFVSRVFRGEDGTIIGGTIKTVTVGPRTGWTCCTKEGKSTTILLGGAGTYT